MGIPCKHLLRVLDRIYADEIPLHFILKRWTKDANRAQIHSFDGLIAPEDPNGVSEAARISHYCRLSTEFAYTIGKSEEAYKVAISFLDQAIEKVRKLEEDGRQCEITEKPDETCLSVTHTFLSDPHISLTKGRPKGDKGKDKTSNTGRLKSGLELSENRKKPRLCKRCTGLGHDSRNCPKKNEDSRFNACPVGYVTDLTDDGVEMVAGACDEELLCCSLHHIGQLMYLLI
ncbi:hypothetical protein BVC80_1707g80 [Macleaya cordata]|uniref:Protein FAR1-RELATED SEQUENCE n=1 Tax=Macleaya cordata TaxID=56857 RepID=A0A200Q664_MACCD|nr:hypothetical protein BVC80_1707g80 [Macleaya cordata]